MLAMIEKMIRKKAFSTKSKMTTIIHSKNADTIMKSNTLNQTQKTKIKEKRTETEKESVSGLTHPSANPSKQILDENSST